MILSELTTASCDDGKTEIHHILRLPAHVELSRQGGLICNFIPTYFIVTHITSEANL